MAVTLVSTTDTDEQMQETAEMFGLESYDADQETGGEDTEHFPDEPPAGADAAQEVPPASETTTAAAPGTAETSTQEPEPPEAAEPERDAQGKFKSKGVQKRFDELTFERREEERKRQAAEQRVADLERKLAEAQAPKPEPKPEEKPKPKAAELPEPKEEDFDDYTGYLKAVTKHALAIQDERIAELEAKLAAAKEETKAEIEQKTAEEREGEARKQAFHGRFEAAKQTLPDLEEVWNAAADVEIAPAMFDAIADYADEEDVSDVSLLYWLCKNPEEAKRLKEATFYDPKTAKPSEVLKANRAAARAAAEIAAEMSGSSAAKPAAAATPAPAAPAQPPKPKVTKAPPPIEPPRSAGTPAGRPDPTTMSVTQLRAYIKTDEGHRWYTDPNGFGMSESDWQAAVNAR